MKGKKYLLILIVFAGCILEAQTLKTAPSFSARIEPVKFSAEKAEWYSSRLVAPVNSRNLQLLISMSSPIHRWDKHLADLSQFFTTAALTDFRKPILSGAPGYCAELNYIRNTEKRITWKAGLLYNMNSIKIFNENYQDTAKITIKKAGIQASIVGVINLNRFTKLLIQPGLTFQEIFMDETTLGHEVDSVSTIPDFTLTNVYDLSFGAVNKNYFAATGRLELLTFLNQNWSLSTAVDGQFSLIKNYRYSSNVMFQNAFFPINLPTNSGEFGVPQLQFSVGLVRKIGGYRRKVRELK